MFKKKKIYSVLILIVLILSVGLTWLIIDVYRSERTDSIPKTTLHQSGFIKKDVKFRRKSSLYKIKSKTLPLYFTKENNQAVPYVALSDMFSLISPLIEQDRVDDADGVFTVQQQQEKGEYTLHIVSKNPASNENSDGIYRVDTKKNTLYFDDISLLSNTVDSNAYSDTNFDGVMEKTGIKKKTKSALIQLDTYGIETFYIHNEVVVPLYLANFLLTGYDLEIGYIHSKTGGYLYTSSMDDFFEKGFSIKKETLKKEDRTYIQEASVEYLHFLMDNFYGLKKYQHVDTYKHALYEKYNLDTAHIDKYQHNLNRFVASLNDMHTSIYKQSYQNPRYSYSSFNIPKQEARYEESSQEYCQYVKDTKTLESFDIDKDTAYISIYSFDGEIKEKLKKIMQRYQNKKNIFFDIRCNTGGYLNDINFVMDYMTNEKYKAYYIDQYGGKNYVETEVVGDQNTDRKFYLVTSGVTFSAANALASTVKDYGVATIIGENSNGGTCAVEHTTLPDGTVLSYSSASSCMTNSKYQIIEKGIVVDVPLDLKKAHKKARNEEDVVRNIVKEEKRKKSKN